MLTGDGRILQMRIKDASGDWKVSPDDARLMVKRTPFEFEGEFYRLFSEGDIEEYDGDIVKIASA